MSDQDARASSRLNHAVQVAEGPSKRHDYGFRPRKSLAHIAKEGFPRFKNLPPEIRSKIWQDAMPPCGIYTVLMLGREEPMPQQPPAPAQVVFRVVYRLEPVPRDQQDHELRRRLETMRAIQHVSSESAYEVQSAFPTTIDCTGGKLRFNALHDTLNLSDLQCLLGSGFFERFERYTQGAVVFADDWNKIPRTMLFNNRTMWIPFSVLTHYHSPRILRFILPCMKGFLDFLTDCTNLETWGLIYDEPIVSFFRLIHLNSTDLVPFSLLGPGMRDRFYERSWDALYYGSFDDFIRGLKGVRALMNGLHPAPEVPSCFKSATFHHPKLQDLQFLTVVPASRDVRDEVSLYMEQ